MNKVRKFSADLILALAVIILLLALSSCESIVRCDPSMPDCEEIISYDAENNVLSTKYVYVDPSILPSNLSAIVAKISASRTDCASPCTVVLSAENTTAKGLDENQVWLELSYYWDFDTDETDTYGTLYKQKYDYVEGDTSREYGHVPLVSKTFLCDIGTCVYKVGIRAQNTAGEFSNAYQIITVRAESEVWSAADTVCISNTLSTAADWTGFDKACPAGATKQSAFPLPDEFDGKLILLKRGDVFAAAPASRDNGLAILSGQSNFKVTAFGNNDDAQPTIDANFYTGIPSYTVNAGEVTAVETRSSLINPALGINNNTYFEDLRIGHVTFPSRFNHMTLHNIDMDWETEPTKEYGYISFTNNYNCLTVAALNCSDIPFSNGAYMSSINIVGSMPAETNDVFVNIVGIGCVMAANISVLNTQVRKAGEHNFRIMGYERLVVQRSAFLGHHYLTVKQKVTARPCISNSLNTLDEQDTYDKVAQQNDDFYTTAIGGNYGQTVTKDGLYMFKLSRYASIIGNVMGEAGPSRGDNPGGTQYQTNAASNPRLIRNVMLTKNVFVNEDDKSNGTQNIGLVAEHSACVDNVYDKPGGGCLGRGKGNALDPVPTPAPDAPF